MAAARNRSPLEVRCLPNDAELVLSEPGSWVLVLRGACHVRSATTETELIRGPTLLTREAEAESGPDLRVSQALGLMCGQLDQRWTVALLAKRVGLSRTAFARRFVLTTGVSPLRYLCELRLARAAVLLQSSDASLAELALAVGYTSEFAFSRAFKRQYRVTPSVFRRRAATRPATIALLRAA